MKRHNKLLILGLLLSFSLLINTNYVNAASGTSLKSSGVINVVDSNTNKSATFDASDLVNMQEQLDGLSEPKLKVTYHEHTDACKLPLSPSGYLTGTLNLTDAVIVTSSGTYIKAPSANTKYTVFCSICNDGYYTDDRTLQDHLGSYIHVLCSRVDDMYTYANSVYVYNARLKYVCPHMTWESIGNRRKFDLSNYIVKRTLASDVYICGKDENTIESVELITE